MVEALLFRAPGSCMLNPIGPQGSVNVLAVTGTRARCLGDILVFRTGNPPYYFVSTRFAELSFEALGRNSSAWRYFEGI